MQYRSPDKDLQMFVASGTSSAVSRAGNWEENTDIKWGRLSTI